MAKLEVRLLGSGTSTGVPLIGCECPVCTSADPRDKRTRFGLWLYCEGFGLELDVSPDFRTQALRWNIPRVDAVVISHCHADHVLGLDDIRRYNTIQDCEIPVYARYSVMRDIKRIFSYIAHPPHVPRSFKMYRPKLKFKTISSGPIEMGPFKVRTLKIPHGPVKSTAVEFTCAGKRVVCASDCSRVTPELLELMRGADLALLDGLRYNSHSAHLSVDDAYAALKASGCKCGRVVHIGHNALHSDLERKLELPVIGPGYDGELFTL